MSVVHVSRSCTDGGCEGLVNPMLMLGIGCADVHKSYE